MQKRFLPGIIAASLFAMPMLASAANKSTDLEKEIEALKVQNKEIMERLDATAEMMETSQEGEAHSETNNKRSTHHGSSGKTTIGGYGEMHYNNLTGEGGATNNKEIDFHRAILFVGHEFTDKIRFFMEWELEHASTMELEQAFLEFDISDNAWVSTGVLLMPFGMINETHEPTTFYGVERNPVAKNIIPTTWREGGVALGGTFGNGWGYDVFATSGLQLSTADGYTVRKGRTQVSEASANNLAYSGRIKWNGIAGLQLSASYLIQDDASQSLDPNIGSASLFSTHVSWEIANFKLRALYAMWDIDGSGPATNGASEQRGWYIEPSYKIIPQVGVFARYNKWDNQAGNSVANSEKIQIDAGVNYWPHPDVVIKADYQNQDNADGKNQNGFNLGIGYQF